MSQKCLVVGDSHTLALKRALAARVGGGALDFDVRWLASARHGDFTIADTVEKIDALGPLDVVVISVMGTMHHVFGLLKADPPFHLGGDRQATTAMITEGLWLHFMQSLNATNIKFKTIRVHVTQRMLHLAVPPPTADNAYIVKRVGRYQNRVLTEDGINAPSLRLKLWQVEVLAVQRICSNWNVEFVPPPREALTEEGFLDPAYRAEDGLHANSAYGELVLRQVERLVASNSSRPG
jgi:hypothetical protein